MRQFLPEYLVDVSTYNDAITRYRLTIALFGVSLTWYGGAYGEYDLAVESRYTRFWCLQSDYDCNEFASNEYIHLKKILLHQSHLRLDPKHTLYCHTFYVRHVEGILIHWLLNYRVGLPWWCEYTGVIACQHYQK